MVPIQEHNMHNYNVHTNISMGKLYCRIIIPPRKSNVSRNNMWILKFNVAWKQKLGTFEK